MPCKYHDGSLVRVGDYFRSFSTTTCYRIKRMYEKPAAPGVTFFDFECYDNDFNFKSNLNGYSYTTNTPRGWIKFIPGKMGPKTGFGKFIREKGL